MNVSNSNSNNDKRSKKPKPLFGLFRKNKPDPVVVPTPLGSGISSVPLHSVLSGQDPYAPPTAPLVRPPKPSVSDPRMPLSPQFQHYQQQQQRQQQQQQQMRRPRSKSTGGNTAKSFHHHQARSTEEARLLTERENALNKLCSNEITSPTSSLKASLPLLSPTYHTPPPPIPPIPHYHKKQPQSPISPITPPPSSGGGGGGGIRKFSSAHDLRKAAKLQQESIVHVTDKIPLPKLNKDQYQLSRSRSLNSSSPRRIPVTTKASLPKKTLPIKNDDDDSDDDIPLGYLQSPISKPSSLLSDEGEEDDKDLIPIAAAITTNTEYQSAADKYKEKVKERLQLDDDDDDDDDDIPISLAMLSPKERTKWHQNQIRG